MISNPQERRTSHRREQLRNVYDSKEWKTNSREFLGIKDVTIRGIYRGEGLQCGEVGNLASQVPGWIEGKKPCEWHESVGIIIKDRTLPHHPYIESYKDGIYIDLASCGCMVLCNRCHTALHTGNVLCKRCGKNYHRVGADMCRSCWLAAHPEIVAAREKKKQEVKDLKKKLKDEEKKRVKEWKAAHPVTRRRKSSAKSQATARK